MIYSFKGGTHPNGNKELTMDKPIEQFPHPKFVVLPSLQHIGAPCDISVKAGDSVKLGQQIADSSAFVSAPIHSSVSGVVSKVEKRLHPNGERVMSVVIENDFLDTPHPDLAPIDYLTLSQDELIEHIRRSGIVGHGGAAFPTHVKIKSGIGKVDSLIFNGAECEPYITSDNRILLEYPWEVIGGIQILQKIFGLNSAFLGIEKNKESTFAPLKEQIGVNGNITLCPLEVKYPQGAEKQLIYAITRREVPSGKLPADAGCAVFNIDTAAAIYRYFTTGMPDVRRIVTVSGDAIANPKNLEARIGTPVSELINAAGGFKTEPGCLLMGGPMMGVALFDTDVPVIKGTNAILSFTDSDASVPTTACIRCGKCVDVCPMALSPTYIYHYSQKGNIDQTMEHNALDCIECGACSYVCPAKIPLVHGIRVAKQKCTELLRAQKK